MSRLFKYVVATVLSLFSCSSWCGGAPAVTEAQEQEAIKQVREQVPKNREEILRKQIPTDWSKLPDGGLRVMPAALAALRLNVDVEQANEAIQKHAAAHPMRADKYPDFYAIMPVYAQIYYLFSSKSSHFPGRLTLETEAAMKEQMWNYIQGTVREAGNLDEPLSIVSTENHDLRARTSLYLFSAALKDDPKYRDRKYHGYTASEHYARLTEFYRKNFKAKALNGLWFEIGCLHYAKMSWACLLVMADVAPDETVRKYARMLLDLAWVEDTEMSFGYRRVGGKFRFDDPLVVKDEFLDQCAPLMFGDEQGVNLYTMPWAASDYQVPDIAILLHRFGSNEPTCEIINKVLSFIGQEQRKGGPLLNYTYKTPQYALGGVMFDPAQRVSAISADRTWSGLIFNDADNSRVAPFPEPRGRRADAFWHIQYKNVMVGQKYKNFRVARMGAFISPKPEREEADGWVFVKLGDAFAAVRPAYGGYTWDNTPAGTDKASGKSVVMNFKDEWAPIILHAGDVAEFGSYAAFKKRILKDSELKVTADAVIYKGPGQPAITFYHKQLNEIRTTKDDKVAISGGPGYAGELKLPEIDGKTVNLRPALSYQSPFMSSVSGTEKVRTSFGGYVQEYDFGNATSTESNKNPKGSTKP